MVAGSAWPLVEWDWVQTPTGVILHHVESLEDPERFVVWAQGNGVTTCGLSKRLVIPGLFSRMDAPRCKKCCKALGWPQGVGSPKNDAKLRPLVDERLEAHHGSR